MFVFHDYGVKDKLYCYGVLVYSGGIEINFIGGICPLLMTSSTNINTNNVAIFCVKMGARFVTHF